VKLSHSPSVRFDEPNLIACAGLAPVLAVADRTGLGQLVRDRVVVPGEAGANPEAKALSLVAGMVAGADTIEAMDLLRHGAMSRLFTGVRAPSTLGLFLRAFTPASARQLGGVARAGLARLAGQAPALLAGADTVAYIDVDDTIRQTHGYKKEHAAHGYSGVKGLNALLATLSSPLAAPVIAATRLRPGNTNSPAGVASFLAPVLADAVRAQRAAQDESGGTRRWVMVRADSGFFTQGLIRTTLRYGAKFSVTARMDPGVSAAVTAIGEDAWIPIKYRNAVWNETDQQWDSDAQVAEVEYTAFTSRRISDSVHGRLIVRRVKRLNPGHVPSGQQELFTTWRYHAIFTNSPLPMLQAEATHRDHAIIEQVIADLKDGPLAHAPSGVFTANAAWLTLAAIAYNLTRAAAVLAGTHWARCRTRSIRARLINVPARVASSARRLTIHLPTRWPWHHGFDNLHTHATGPPQTATT
jgi:Transposase DDE domain group 1